MELRATLDVNDLQGLVADLFPFRVRLEDAIEDRKFVDLLNPRDVRLLPGEGFEMTCDARVEWPVPIVGSLHVDIEDVTVVVPLTTRTEARGAVLRFGLRLQNLSVRAVPGMVDDAVTARINDELLEHDTGLEWDIGESLSVALALPERLVPLELFETALGDVTVVVTSEGVEVTAPMRLSMRRTAAGGAVRL